METRRLADLCADDSLSEFMLYLKSIIVCSLCATGKSLAVDLFILVSLWTWMQFGLFLFQL